MDFDPNVNRKAPGKPEWATYIPDRKPQFKVYTNRGHALNSFQYRSNVILYRLGDNGKWIEAFRIEDWSPAIRCELCTTSVLKVSPTGQVYNVGYRKWIDKETDHPKIITVCMGCRK